MTTMSILPASSFEKALVAARQVLEGDELLGLTAPLDGVNEARLAEAWEAVQGVLRQVYRRGKQLAAAEIDKTIEKVKDLVAAAGNKGRALQDALLGMLQTFLASLVEHALRQVRPSIEVSGRTLTLERVQVQHTISVSGSVKASIQDICAFISSGQVTIASEYSTPVQG